MRVTTQGEYGLRCLARLADDDSGKPISVSRLAKSEGLSRDYVEQLLLRLRRAGLVRSTRGVQGGYSLSRPPDRIAVGEVLRVLEGPLFELPCKRRPGGCHKLGDCLLVPLWEGLESRIAEYLDAHSLADVSTLMARPHPEKC